MKNVKTRFYNAPGQWIYAPKEASLFIRYEDGSNTKVSAVIEIDPLETLVSLNINFPKDTRKINAIKLIVPSYGIIPDGLQGAGNKAWTFIDEIVVE